WEIDNATLQTNSPYNPDFGASLNVNVASKYNVQEPDDALELKSLHDTIRASPTSTLTKIYEMQQSDFTIGVQ
uniref:Uncharacterized protein n=1 Tax=Romanomermis culicivorax TaxID=13658 RepID=A0A915IB41_ROMCU